MKLISLFIGMIFINLSFAKDELRFKRLSIDDGLSQSTVETTLQDRTGFMWFGTEDGLNRYDGYMFKIYKHDPDDSTSISNNNIWCLHEDHEGYIWIGTYSDGLNRYDPVTETFRRFAHHPTDSSGLNSDNIRCIAEDSSGYLWIGTKDKGINCINLKTGRFENRLRNHVASVLLAERIIRNIFIDPDNSRLPIEGTVCTRCGLVQREDA